MVRTRRKRVMRKRVERRGRTHFMQDVEFSHDLSLFLLCCVQRNHLHRHYHLGRLVESSGRKPVSETSQTSL